MAAEQDIKDLKASAYDALVQVERYQIEMNKLNQYIKDLSTRISSLSEAKEAKKEAPVETTN